MHMSFWFDYKLQDLLFKGLSTDSVGEFSIVCFFIFVFGFVIEGLRVLHADAKIRTHSVSHLIQQNPLSPHDSTTLLGEMPKDVRRKRAFNYFIEVSLYTTQMVVSFLLMLAVMSFNGYITIVVLLGYCAGHAVFGSILNERQMRNVRLVMPCRHCLTGEGKGSTEVTILDEGTTSGCSSHMSRPQNMSEVPRN